MKFAPLLLNLLVPLATLADEPAERSDHYHGLPAPTLEIAWQNYTEHNTELEALLTKASLSARDLDTIHQLTYTLENALERIKIDLDSMADTLEALHLSSEQAQREAVAEHGKDYLQKARAFRE